MLSPKEVGLALDCSAETVRRWIRDGRLKARRHGISGQYEIAQAELFRFCKTNDVHICNPFLQRVAE